MALELNYKYKGIDISSAYLRVVGFRWAAGTKAIVTLAVYLNESARANHKPPVDLTPFEFEIDLSNLEDKKTQAFNQLRDLIYCELKQQPQFASGQDV